MNPYELNRRTFLGTGLSALGWLGMGHLLARDGGPAPDPLSPRPPHHPAKAKAVICLFQHGGPSQVDLFDHKPVLNAWHGRDYPGSLEVHFHEKKGKCLGTSFRFSRHGRCGMEFSELLPHTASIADEITLVRSMVTDSVDHERALRIIHNGQDHGGRPVWGSWVLYGLGSEREDLPAYVVLGDPGGMPVDGPKNWTSGFLPAIYQGTPLRSQGDPVVDLRSPEGLPAEGRRSQLRLLERLNRGHLARHPENTELAARISNYELAARMQTSVPEALDLAGEPGHVRKLYGLDNPATAEYGKRCLMARRLVERGVRVVQLYLSGQPWDTHDKNAEKHRELTGRIDRPSAGLVEDLKQRGLLDSTIVLWTGEFGRLPVSQDKDGRDHNRHAFSLWLAGGGFRRGYVHGATDEFGYSAVEKVVRVNDLHATMLRALGLDHARLTYPHDGRLDSLTDPVITRAKVVPELLA
jgi:hypothetical protein